MLDESLIETEAAIIIVPKYEIIQKIVELQIF